VIAPLLHRVVAVYLDENNRELFRRHVVAVSHSPGQGVLGAFVVDDDRIVYAHSLTVGGLSMRLQVIE